MAGEFLHVDVGDELSKSEYGAASAHYASGQTLGDIVYYDGSAWVRKSGSSLFTTKTIVTKTSAYTIASTDDSVICNSTAAFTITLPSATGSGKSYMIKNINSGAVTVTGTGSDTIDGETTQTLYQYEGINVIDSSANIWIVI